MTYFCSRGLGRRELLRFGLALAWSPAASKPWTVQDRDAPTKLPDVRQLVTFRLAPGKTGDVIAAFREHAVPLYRNNEAMRRFRAYREVESPVPLDLIMVSTFRGMSGMDQSNARLRELAAEANKSIGEIYGAIGSMSVSHHDQFVAMIDDARAGNADAAPLTVFESIELTSEDTQEFERHLVEEIIPWEHESRILTGSESARVLIGSGWHYLRFLGIDNLEALGEYLAAVRKLPSFRRAAGTIRRYQRVVAGNIPVLSVR